MTALATSPNFEGAHERKFIAESGPLLFTGHLGHAVVLDIFQVKWRFSELLGKLGIAALNKSIFQLMRDKREFTRTIPIKNTRHQLNALLLAVDFIRGLL